MAEIRVQVPGDFMEVLKEKLCLKTNADVVQEALTLLNWAAEEKCRRRLILSADKNGHSVERLAMRSLTVIDWTHDEVGPAYDALKADRTLGKTAEEVRASLKKLANSIGDMK